MQISIASHTSCKMPPASDPVPIVPPKNRGIVQGTTYLKIGTSPAETASQPTMVLASGAKIYGISKSGFSTIGKPKAIGS